MRSSPWLRLSTSGIAAAAIGLASTAVAHADDKECMSAASDGQEIRDQGRLMEARGYFQRCAQSACPAPIPTYCAEWLSDDARKIPTLVIRVVDQDERDITDAQVIVDERTLDLDGRAVEVDPGRHRIRVARARMKSFDTEIVAAQGEKDRIIVAKLVAEAPAPSPPVKPAPQHPWTLGPVPKASWMAWGVGAAGLLSFSVFGLKARLDYDSYRSTCDRNCTMSDRDSVARTITVADVSLVVGLVGAGVGTVLFLMQPEPAPRPRASATR